MSNTPNQALNDLAHNKVDPYQDPDYKPQMEGEQKATPMPRPVNTTQSVGQEDSLTDQPREGVSESEQMAPASYEPKDPKSLEEDTDLDDSMEGDELLSSEKGISSR